MKKLLYAVMISILLMTCRNAFACSCNFSDDPIESFKAAERVFIGKVVKVRDNADMMNEIQISDGLSVEFEIVEVFKGGNAKVVRTAESMKSCGYPFKEGETYFVYVEREPYDDLLKSGGGQVSVSLCSRTRPLAEAGEDVAAIRKYLVGVEQGLVASLRIPSETVCADDFIVEFVLTNTTDQDIKIFERWNSWGAFNWRFEVKDEKGDVVIFNNPQQVWTINGPSTQVIKSGEGFILKGHLWFDRGRLDQAWEYDYDPRNKLATFMPTVKINDLKGKLSIKGIYDSNEKNEETTVVSLMKEEWQDVWQGKITTDWHEVEIKECKEPSE